MGTSFHGGPRWKTWKRAHMPGAYVWKKVLGRVSLPIGAPLGYLGRGSPSTRNFENQPKEGSGYGASLYGSSVRGTWRGGGARLLGALKVMKGWLWRRTSLFMGAQLGNLKWAHLPVTLRDG